MEKNSISCETEPIHLINELQDFGLIIFLSFDDNKIIACGENSYEYLKLSPNEVLRRKPVEIFENFSQYKERISEVLFNKNQEEFKIQFLFQEQLMFATFRKSEKFIFCEIERDNPNYALDIFNDLLTEFNELSKINMAQKLYDFAVEEIRTKTKFDRVLLYKFNEDFTGEVIAESRNHKLTSLLGFHFPATDIPAPAREIYLKNSIRLIHSRQEKQINLTKSDEYQNYNFDMGASILRAPHSHHLEYLRNMGIVTSMSISLTAEKKLWGLFICHSLEKLVPSTFIRNYLSIFSKSVFRQIDLLNKHRESLEEIKIQELFTNLIQKLNSVSLDNIINVFEKHIHLLMKEFESDGLYLQFNNKSLSIGIIPEKAILEKIIFILSTEFAGKFFFTNDLQKSFPDKLTNPDKANGILSIPLSSNKNDRIIWFRGDVIKTIIWGGNKEEAFTISNNQISPRRSFDKWIETVKGKSIPWSGLHIKIISELQRITEIIDKKIAENKLIETLELIKASEKELQDLNATKDKFFSIVSHNLRGPFSGLLGISELLKDSVNVEPPQMDEIKEYSELIHISSLKAFDLLKNLFEWGKIQTNKIKIRKEYINLSFLIEEIIYSLSKKLQNKEITLITECKESINLFTDKDALMAVMNNILMNSIKYSYRQSQILLSAKEVNSTIQIEIEDSGIGMTDLEIKKLFKIEEHFNMPGTNGETGTGLGLIISKEYIEKLNFKIVIESQKGKGTKVMIICPFQYNLSMKSKLKF
ncbi:MAG: GAF domain-containing protein [Leptospiraceae bacterium]|nr:GAF domain-containing protein [Leptospiraceae bacterium]